jgi:hypothetical protein
MQRFGAEDLSTTPPTRVIYTGGEVLTATSSIWSLLASTRAEAGNYGIN